jgi:N-acetylmuramoyl-L-alanine amidase
MMKWDKNTIIASILFTVFFIFILVAPFYPYKKASNENARQIKSLGIKIGEVQKKLRELGYYKNEINGRYDYRTYWAITMFQREKGLEPDGILKRETVEKLGILLVKKEEPKQYSQEDVYLLARAIYGEARGEPYVGKVAVAAVILNRVKSPEFPNTIAGVIFQPGAFTAVSDGQINLTPDEESLAAARDAINGWDPTGGALYYYNPEKSTSEWIWSRKVHLVIGKHHFAK